MGYKVLASMNIAVIGSGPVSEAYASGFAYAGHNVFLAMKDGDDSGIDPLLELHPNLVFSTIEDAAAVADLIVIAMPPRDVREVAYWLGDVRRKVIIDASANVHAPEEELVRTVCAIHAITGSPHVVKVFNTRGYEAWVADMFQQEKIDLFMVSNSIKAKEITRIMAGDLGMRYCFDFGDNQHIPFFNEMTKMLRRMYSQQKVARKTRSRVHR